MMADATGPVDDDMFSDTCCGPNHRASIDVASYAHLSRRRKDCSRVDQRGRDRKAAGRSFSRCIVAIVRCKQRNDARDPQERRI